MERIANNKEVRLEDKHRHFLGKMVKERVYVYCGRCKEFYEVDVKGGGATSQNPN